MQAELTAKNFKLDDVEFEVQKIPYADGKEIIDRVRVTLGRLKDLEIRDLGEDADKIGNLLLQAISLFSVQERKELDDLLFKYLKAKLPNAQAYIQVLGNEEVIFAENIFNSYLAATRTFTASFLDSFLASLSISGIETLASSQPAPRT